MNKTLILLFFGLILFSTMTWATTSTIKETKYFLPHWMPNTSSEKYCSIPLWWGGSARGIIGLLSNGSTTCYVPRRGYHQLSTKTTGNIETQCFTEIREVCEQKEDCSNVWRCTDKCVWVQTCTWKPVRICDVW